LGDSLDAAREDKGVCLVAGESLGYLLAENLDLPAAACESFDCHG
jgi:hypothetical protein